MVPVAEIQFLGFALQAWHHLVGQIPRTRYRTQGTVGTQITVRAPFGGGLRTPELHADSFIGQLTNVPGLKVVAPGSAADMKGLLTAAIRDPDPVVVLEPLRGYRLIKDDVPDGDYEVPLGSARTIGNGTDLAIITWSFMTPGVALGPLAPPAWSGTNSLGSGAANDIRVIIDNVHGAGAFDAADAEGLARILSETFGRCV